MNQENKMEILYKHGNINVVLKDETLTLEKEEVVEAEVKEKEFIDAFKNIFVKYKEKLVKFSDLQKSSDEFSSSKMLIGGPTHIVYGIIDNIEIKVNGNFRNDELHDMFFNIYLAMDSLIKKIEELNNKTKWEDIKMSEEELKKIVEEVIGNNDPFWNQPVLNVVKKIIEMPNGTQSTISELLGAPQGYPKQILNTARSVVKVCQKINIVLDFGKENAEADELLGTLPFTKMVANETGLNLDELIKKVSGPDPFWQTIIKKYFDNLSKTNEEKIIFLQKLSLDKKVFNDFSKEINSSSNPNDIYDKYIKILN